MIGISEAEFEMVLFVILPFITAGCIIIYLVISLYEDYKRNNKFKHYEDYYKWNKKHLNIKLNCILMSNWILILQAKKYKCNIIIQENDINSYFIYMKMREITF